MARKVTSRRLMVSTAAAWGFGFLIFLPILWMALTSFKTELDAFAMPPKFLFFHWTTENYATVQSRSDYVHHALNSIRIERVMNVVAAALHGCVIFRRPVKEQKFGRHGECIELGLEARQRHPQDRQENQKSEAPRRSRGHHQAS